MMEFEIGTSRLKGIFFIIMSGLGFALMSLFIKESGDLSTFQKVFFRNLVSFFIAGFLVVRNKSKFFGKKESKKLLIMRSFFGTFGMVMNFYAIDHLFISDASMINKISPFLVVLFSYLFLKEKIKINHAITILIAFSGTMLIVKPSFNVEVIPYIVALLGAISGALAYTCLRAISGEEDYYTIVFFFSAFSAIVTLVPFIYFYQPMTMYQFLCLVLSGMAASMGQFGITLAYKYAPAREISIFDYSNVIFTAIFGFLFFSELPDLLSVIGYLIIFGAAFYMYSFNKRTYNC